MGHIAGRGSFNTANANYYFRFLPFLSTLLLKPLAIFSVPHITGISGLTTCNHHNLAVVKSLLKRIPCHSHNLKLQ
jgi:hypothetical protein